MKKPDTSKLQKLDKTLAEVDLSFKNWKLSVNWFDPLSEIDLEKLREGAVRELPAR